MTMTCRFLAPINSSEPNWNYSRLSSTLKPLFYASVRNIPSTLKSALHEQLSMRICRWIITILTSVNTRIVLLLCRKWKCEKKRKNSIATGPRHLVDLGDAEGPPDSRHLSSFPSNHHALDSISTSSFWFFNASIGIN